MSGERKRSQSYQSLRGIKKPQNFELLIGTEGTPPWQKPIRC